MLSRATPANVDLSAGTRYCMWVTPALLLQDPDALNSNLLGSKALEIDGARGRRGPG
jgi:hypothetical protein